MKGYKIISVQMHSKRFISPDKPKAWKKHMQEAKDWVEFSHKFFEKMSGMTRKELMKKWLLLSPSMSDDVTKEYLLAEHGIIFCRTWDRFMHIYIPEDKTDVVTWITDNLKSPYKFLKKGSSTVLLWKPSTYWRDIAEKDAERFWKKHPNWDDE